MTDGLCGTCRHWEWHDGGPPHRIGGSLSVRPFRAAYCVSPDRLADLNVINGFDVSTRNVTQKRTHYYFTPETHGCRHHEPKAADA